MSSDLHVLLLEVCHSRRGKSIHRCRDIVLLWFGDDESTESPSVTAGRRAFVWFLSELFC